MNNRISTAQHRTPTGDKPTAISELPGAKAEHWGKIPAQGPPQGWADPLRQASCRPTDPPLLLSSSLRTKEATLWEQQGHLFLVFAPLSYRKSLNKIFPEILPGLLSISTWLKGPKTPVGNTTSQCFGVFLYVFTSLKTFGNMPALTCYFTHPFFFC